MYVHIYALFDISISMHVGLSHEFFQTPKTILQEPWVITEDHRLILHLSSMEKFMEQFCYRIRLTLSTLSILATVAMSRLQMSKLKFSLSKEKFPVSRTTSTTASIVMPEVAGLLSAIWRAYKEQKY